MSRTNIDIDDALVSAVMQRFNLATKKSAVDLALKRLLDSTDQLAALEGIWNSGWDGDLEKMRNWKPGE
jgi:Arc/MetJ family transcription regulator